MRSPKRPAKKSYHHGNLQSELLKAAEAELAEHGVEEFSLRGVAKRAGVSHGAPAHHFKDARGLLTALAALGYERFLKKQNRRQQRAKRDPESQLVASGLGYVDFAEKNPALFRLMFSSEKPDRTNDHFAAAANSAFDKLVANIRSVLGTDPYTDPVGMRQVMASWAMVHGLADLIIAGRAERPMGFGQMTAAEREAALADIMLRALKGNPAS